MTPGPSKQFDREVVLERAMNLFWEHGYEATSMTQLLESMEIGRQSLYDTFGDKRSLFLEALKLYVRLRVGPMIDQLKAPGPAMENVRGVLRIWERMAEEGRFKGCMVGNSAAELAHNDPEIARRLSGYFMAMEDAFFDVLSRAQKEGDLPSGRNPRQLARTLVNVMQGVALISRVTTDPEVAKAVIHSASSLLEK